MKLRAVLLRWYKSFHLNYRGTFEKGETREYRPWNKMSPSFAAQDIFPFIEIPVESDITTIVGANESGKSHLLNAISKVATGKGIESGDVFKRTDLCHFAGIRTRNVEAWPNIGLRFEIENAEESTALSSAIGGAVSPSGSPESKHFVLILAPDEEPKKPARIYIEPSEQAVLLDESQLSRVRALLPTVRYIHSQAQLASEIPLASLLVASGDKAFESVGLLDRKKMEEAAGVIRRLTPPPPQNAVGQEFLTSLSNAKKSIDAIPGQHVSPDGLEMQLFREILEITPETLRYIYERDQNDRGYVEGQIAKWNDELNDKLNLSHFWKQDEQFSLSMNCKDGVVYFEIRDKTDSIYTFRERSSGLRYFLSYYIQAKAMELSHKNRNSIILMDEPDSALSILGQRNLLAVFESLVSPESSHQTCQLIYTTHSPYLINRNFPRRIRVVKKEESEEGTQYIEQARARRYEPVRTALGIDSAPSLFLGADNILLEGATDQYILTELIRVFATPENVGQFLDLNSVVFVSADGVGNVENVLEQSRWADEPIPPTAVVIDSDPPANDVASTITGNNPKKKRKLIDVQFVGQIGTLVTSFSDNVQIVTTEDIIPKCVYAQAVLHYIEKWLPETWEKNAATCRNHVASPEYGTGGLVESTKALFRGVKPEFGGEYDKMGVLQEVVSHLSAGRFDDQEIEAYEALRANVIAICDFIREALERSRAVTLKYSSTQTVKRVINDFNRLNKDNVSISAIQKLLRRLEREVAPVGADGEIFVKAVNSYLAELESLRTAGQVRMSGVEWEKWKMRVDAMKNNPLNPLIVADGGGKAASK